MNEDEEFEALEQRLNMKEQEYEQINHPNGVTTWKTKPKHKEQAMNREDIIKMARDISNTPHNAHTTPDLFGETQIVKFFQAAYAAGAAAEREACAKVCEQEWNKYCVEPSGYALAVNECAASIRARSKQ